MRKCTRHIIRQLVKMAMKKKLSQEEQTMLDEHLKTCPNCREMTEKMLAARAEREAEFPARLTNTERDELKRRVLRRIQDVEPDAPVREETD